jgi:hypothetical protein
MQRNADNLCDVQLKLSRAEYVALHGVINDSRNRIQKRMNSDRVWSTVLPRLGCAGTPLRVDLATLLQLYFFCKIKMMNRDFDFFFGRIYMENTPNYGQIGNSHAFHAS